MTEDEQQNERDERNLASLRAGLLRPGASTAQAPEPHHDYPPHWTPGRNRR